MPPPDKPCSFGLAGLSADEIATMDPDYVYFLRHVRPEGQAYAVEIPSKDVSSRPQVVRYEKHLAAPNAEPLAARSDGGTRGACSRKEDDHPSAALEVPSGDASPPAGPDDASPPASPEDEARGGAVEVEGDDLLSSKVEPAWYDSVSNIDEDYRFFLQHSRVLNDSQWVFEMGNVSMTFGEAASVHNCEDEDEEEEDEEEVDGIFGSGDNNGRTEEENNMEIKTKVKEELSDTVKNVEEDEVDEVEVISLSGDNSVRTEEENNLEIETKELEGVIWPAHIIERSESDFKRNLVKVLIKPFNQEEYEKLFAMAMNRSPVIKERRTRQRVMYYPWKHEMGKSYFDSYPDLADQVEGESSYPNRLALLRGFFFWLENVGHDDQFRPWSDDYKKYRVLYCTGS